MSLRKDPSLCRFKGCRSEPARGKGMCREHSPLFERVRRELAAERERAYVIRRTRRKRLIPREPD